MKNFNDFDKDFKRTEKMIIVAFIINVLIAIGLIAFFVWVIVKVLQYFGVI